MGIVGRLLGRERPDEDVVTERIRAAIDGVPGASAQDTTYRHQRYSSGMLSGIVGLDAVGLFDVVLEAVTRVLVAELGDAADRVTIYLSGQAPDGSVQPGDLGMAQPPTGTELRRRYLPPGG